MTKIIMNGCNGRMGQVISRLAKEDNNAEIVAGFDINDNRQNDYPVFTNPKDCDIEADAIIDFSHPSSLESITEYAKQKNIPIIVATTGLSAEQKEYMKNMSSSVPVFFSANMSLGINLITNLAKKAAAVLEGSFDIEIVEKHHNQKLDAPSGTALSIAEAIDETLSAPSEFVYDRHSVRRKRRKNEIGIHAVRGGTIVGDHDVIFAGNDEIIQISHHAASREIFAVGAIKAAKFMKGKSAGMYNMQDLIDNM